MPDQEAISTESSRPTTGIGTLTNFPAFLRDIDELKNQTKELGSSLASIKKSAEDLTTKAEDASKTIEKLAADAVGFDVKLKKNENLIILGFVFLLVTVALGLGAILVDVLLARVWGAPQTPVIENHYYNRR